MEISCTFSCLQCWIGQKWNVYGHRYGDSTGRRKYYIIAIIYLYVWIMKTALLQYEAEGVVDPLKYMCEMRQDRGGIIQTAVRKILGSWSCEPDSVVPSQSGQRKASGSQPLLLASI